MINEIGGVLMKDDILISGLENFLNQSICLSNDNKKPDKPPIQMDYGIIEVPEIM